MRVITLLVFVCLIQANAVTYAQISIQAKKMPIDKVLEQVSQQSGYDLIYIDQDLKNTTPVNVKLNNVSIETALNKIFEEQPLQYVLSDKTIMVKRKNLIHHYTTLTPAHLSLQELISGRVVDERNIPLSGATIYVLDNNQKRTDILTQTNENGFFELIRLNDVEKDVYLEVTYVGYNLQKVLAKTKMGTIVLKPLTTEVDEVIVTGMFSRPIENFTGSATTIKGDDLRKVNTTDIFKSIAAMDPAFNILANNAVGGNINQLPEVQIRGQNSFPTLSDDITTNPNQPLFVLDGFEVSIERIKDLDINTIASVVILKDASATTIYGSRGANGVMVINTLVPESGKLRVSLVNDISISTPDLSVYSLLNAQEKLDFEQRIGIYTDEDPNIQYALNQTYNERLKAVTAGINTDWRNLPVQTGINNRTSVSLTGGDESIRYGILAGANFQNGVMKEQDRTNYNGQFDFSYLLKKIRFSNSGRIYQTTANESPYGSFQDYLKQNPYWSPYDSEGNLKYYLENFTASGSYAYTTVETNPLYNATLNSISRTRTFGFQNNLSIRYDILPSLFIDTKLGITREQVSSDNFLPGNHTSFENVSDQSLKGSYTKGQTERLNYEFASYLNYNKKWNKHLLLSTFSFDVGSRSTDTYSIKATGFATDNLDHILYATAYQASSKPSGSEGKINRVGLLFNGNYSYDNRYLADISVRRDGSSTYGTDRKFGDFWSIGLGWNIHNEAFFVKNEQINRLKLRATYGVTGSLEIPAYTSQTQYVYDGDNTYEGNLAVIMQNIGNPNLGWQEKSELNFGTDIELFKSRLNFRLDYYNATTNQAITQLNLAPSVGFTMYYENYGKINNKGIELAVQYKIINDVSKNIIWTIFANGLHNKNTLLEISDNLKALNQNLNSASNTIPNFLFKEGGSTTSIYAVRSLGIDPSTGREVYLKKDGVTKTYTWSAEDKIAYGNSIPTFQGTWGTNLFYKGFEVGLIFDYRFGGQIYNQTLVNKVENINPRYNVDRRAYDLGWTKPGDVSLYRRLYPYNTTITYTSTRFIEDDNTLNLNSLSLGYLFTNQAFVRRLGLRSFRLRATTNDLFRLSSVQVERGTDNPFARTYSLSIYASF